MRQVLGADQETGAVGRVAGTALDDAAQRVGDQPA
jgi:hypothetical protein